MGPTWVLSAPDGPHVGPMNLAIRVEFNNHISKSSQRRSVVTHVFWRKQSKVSTCRFIISHTTQSSAGIMVLCINKLLHPCQQTWSNKSILYGAVLRCVKHLINMLELPHKIKQHPGLTPRGWKDRGRGSMSLTSQSFIFMSYTDVIYRDVYI